MEVNEGLKGILRTECSYIFLSFPRILLNNRTQMLIFFGWNCDKLTGVRGGHGLSASISYVPYNTSMLLPRTAIKILLFQRIPRGWWRVTNSKQTGLMVVLPWKTSHRVVTILAKWQATPSSPPVPTITCLPSLHRPSYNLRNLNEFKLTGHQWTGSPDT